MSDYGEAMGTVMNKCIYNRFKSILCQEDLNLKELSEQKEQFERRYWLKAQGYDLDRVVEKVAKVFEIKPQ